jgi:hypothetical protein
LLVMFNQVLIVFRELEVEFFEAALGLAVHACIVT